MQTACPSDRNLEIYAQVTYAQRSWRDVAEQYDISPARVGQIVSQVTAWQVANAPACVTSEHRQKQLVVSYQTHVARMEHWIGSSMQKASELLAKEESAKTQQALRLMTTAMRMSREQMNAAYAMCKATLISEETVLIEPGEPPVGGLAQEIAVAEAPDDAAGVTDCETRSSDDATNESDNAEVILSPWRAGAFLPPEPLPAAIVGQLTRQQRKRLRRAEKRFAVASDALNHKVQQHSTHGFHEAQTS